MPHYIEDYDGLYFVASLERYSVLELRPHFPGYPIFVWLGYVFNFFTRDAALAFHLISSLASTLTALPIAALAASWSRLTGNTDSQTRGIGVLAAVLWWLIPSSWIDGTEIYADPLATTLCLTMLWFAWQGASQKTATRALIIAAVMAGMMLGVRSQYLGFIPVLLLAYFWRRKIQPLERGYIFWVALLTPILIWFGWQLYMDGIGFFQAASSTAVGHYSNWGVSVATDPQPLTRPLRIVETISVLGLGGWWWGEPWTRAIISLLFLVFLGLGLRRLHQTRVFIFSIVFAVLHLLWWLSSLDPVAARYGLPILAWVCVVTALGVAQLASQRQWLIVPVLLGLLGWVSLPLAKEHQNSLPLELQLANYFQDRPNLEDIILFQPEPVIQLRMALPELKLESLPMTSVGANRTDLTAFERQIYGSNLRLEPFQASYWWQPVKRFCRSKYFRLRSQDVLEIALYKYQPSKSRAGIANPKIQSCP